MTNLLYLQNPKLIQTSAKVIDIIQTEKGRGVVLDQTIFYVQGGGQPGDSGRIYNNSGWFEISKTFSGDEGVAVHLISDFRGNIQPGDQVQLKINVELRHVHSRIHSAGHLIDLAISNLSLAWQPAKGYHFPQGSYVEYQLLSSSHDADQGFEPTKKSLQQEFDKLVQAAIPVLIEFDSNKQFRGRPLRTISFDGQSKCPCGGTHVINTSELAGFQIIKIKAKNGLVRVSYGLGK